MEKQEVFYAYFVDKNNIKKYFRALSAHSGLVTDNIAYVSKFDRRGDLLIALDRFGDAYSVYCRDNICHTVKTVITTEDQIFSFYSF